MFCDCRKPLGSFKPTRLMRLYAFKRAKLGDTISELEISKLLDIRNETISRWKNNPEFITWLEEVITTYRMPILELLEQVAIDNLHDFRFWKEIAEKYGYFEKVNKTPFTFKLRYDPDTL